MISFLRRIRKSLIELGSARKYLLYSVGEILLVMIGILLALQVNNWNEWRKDRIVEQELLQEVKNNIEMNIRRINSLHEFQKKNAKSCKILLTAIEGRQIWNDSLSKHIEKALLILPTTVSFSSMESLKSRGFEIIQSNILREKIINLFEMNYNNQLTTMTRIINIELKPNIAGIIMSNFDHENDTNHVAILKPNDTSTILKNQEFKNILKHVQFNRENIISNLETTSLEKSREVLQLIKNELHGADR